MGGPEGAREPAVRFEFVETKVFTKRIAALALENQLRQLQMVLVANPEAGTLDPGTGGLRKVRLADPNRGKGKRGGARVHYLLLAHTKRIYLLSVYGKDEANTLTMDQKKQLRVIVEGIKRDASG